MVPERRPESGADPAIIDRVLARKLFNDADPLGRQILLQPRVGEPTQLSLIVGVVGEMRHDIFDLEPRPHV